MLANRRHEAPDAGASEELALIDALYADLAEPRPWATFLKLLEARLPCDHAVAVLRWPSSADAGAMFGSDRAVAAVRGADMLAACRFDDRPANEVHCLSDRFQGAPASAVAPAVADVMGVDVRDPASGGVVRFRCVRRAGGEPFDLAERRLMRSLIPRLGQAARLQATIAMQRFDLEDWQQVCAELEVGKVTVTESLRIVRQDRAASAILALQDGFVAVNGMLTCADRRAQSRLERMIAETIAFAPDGKQSFNPALFYVQRPSGGGFWSVAFRRGRGLPWGEQELRPVVQVMVKCASCRPAVTQPLLEQVFGFTRAEANIARRLVDGQTLYEAADDCGISRNTARVHLAAIFSKSHVNRQAHLVGAILSRLNSGWTLPRAH